MIGMTASQGPPNHANLSKQVLTDFKNAPLPKLPRELWDMILDELLVSDAPLVDPSPDVDCDHLHGSLPGYGPDHADKRGVAECLEAIHGPRKTFTPTMLNLNILRVSKALCAAGLTTLYAKNVFFYTSRPTLKCFKDRFASAAELQKKVVIIAQILPNLRAPADPLGRPAEIPSILRETAPWNGLKELKVLFTNWRGPWYLIKKKDALDHLQQHLDEVAEAEGRLLGMSISHTEKAVVDQKSRIEDLHMRTGEIVATQLVSNDDLCQNSVWFLDWARPAGLAGWKARKVEVFGLNELDDKQYKKACEKMFVNGGQGCLTPLFTDRFFGR